MEKERPMGPPPEENNPERDDVHLSANRCPYCHTNVQISALDWVSCRSCQARHHHACWTELQHCGSCGEERFLSDQIQSSEIPSSLEEALFQTQGPVTIDQNPKQRRLATVMTVFMSVALAIALALAASGELDIGGAAISLLTTFTVVLSIYARTGFDPVGFGQPINSKIEDSKEPQKTSPKGDK